MGWSKILITPLMLNTCLILGNKSQSKDLQSFNRDILDCNEASYIIEKVFLEQTIMPTDSSLEDIYL